MFMLWKCRKCKFCEHVDCNRTILLNRIWLDWRHLIAAIKMLNWHTRSADFLWRHEGGTSGLDANQYLRRLSPSIFRWILFMNLSRMVLLLRLICFVQVQATHKIINHGTCHQIVDFVLCMSPNWWSLSSEELSHQRQYCIWWKRKAWKIVFSSPSVVGKWLAVKKKWHRVGAIATDMHRVPSLLIKKHIDFVWNTHTHTHPRYQSVCACESQSKWKLPNPIVLFLRRSCFQHIV